MIGGYAKTGSREAGRARFESDALHQSVISSEHRKSPQNFDIVPQPDYRYASIDSASAARPCERSRDRLLSGRSSVQLRPGAPFPRIPFCNRSLFSVILGEHVSQSQARGTHSDVEQTRHVLVSDLACARPDHPPRTHGRNVQGSSDASGYRSARQARQLGRLARGDL